MTIVQQDTLSLLDRLLYVFQIQYNKNSEIPVYNMIRLKFLGKDTLSLLVSSKTEERKDYDNYPCFIVHSYVRSLQFKYVHFI